jgi:hypothetical protein
VKLAALIVTTAALAIAGVARAEPPILLGYVNTPWGYAEPRGECSYCQTLTVTLGADTSEFAYSADNPIAFAYAMQLTAPCPVAYRPECKPSSNRTVEIGWAPWWATPETDTLQVWAERGGKRCSPRQTVTLPAVVNAGCTAATVARHHNHRMRR